MRPDPLLAWTLTRSKPEFDTLNCVQAHSPSADDLLPGLCALAQQWLEDVLLLSFRCCADATPSLDAWFGDGRVRLHLQVCVGTALYINYTL